MVALSLTERPKTQNAFSGMLVKTDPVLPSMEKLHTSNLRGAHKIIGRHRRNVYEGCNNIDAQDMGSSCQNNTSRASSKTVTWIGLGEFGCINMERVKISSKDKMMS